MALQVILRDEFCRASRKPPGACADFLSAVVAERPELAGRKPKEDGGGFSKVLIFGNDAAFKGLELYRLRGYLEQEHKVLRHLEDRGVPFVPRVTHVGEKAFFFGMTVLPGRDMREKDLRRMPDSGLRALADGISHFALRLSGAFSNADADSLLKVRYGLTSSPEALAARMYSREAIDIFGIHAVKLAAAMREYAEKTAAQQKVVIHGDLKESNVRVTGDGAFGGVLDFGCMDVAPPAGLFADFFRVSKPFADMLCQSYSAQGGQPVTVRDAGLHAIAVDLGRRFSPLWSDEPQVHEQKALASLRRLEL